MEAELGHLRDGVDAVASVDVRTVDVDELRTGLLALHRQTERLRLVEAAWLAEAERAAIWHSTGARTAADWLATATGTSHVQAGGLLKLAQAVDRSPALARAVEAGDVSTESAIAVHDLVVAPPLGADVEGFVDCLTGATPRLARDTADTFRELHRTDPVDEVERVRQRRALRQRNAGDGTVVTTLVLPVLEARQFHQAVHHAAGDAFDGDDRTAEQRLADGAVRIATTYATASLGGGRERATVLVTISADALAGATEQPGRTDHGDVVPAEVVRRLAESARLQRLVHQGSRVLELGRAARLASDDQYRALVARDAGCRWPGCTIPARWCEVDHLVAWEHGGSTDLDNLVLWCSHHHHTKHRSDVIVTGSVDDLTIVLPDGSRRRSRPPGLDRAPAA
jgi:hypothetical protein